MEHFIPDGLVDVFADTDDIFDLACVDAATVVLVEHPERTLQLLVGEDLITGNGRRHELTEVDFARLVGVNHCEDAIDLVLGKLVPVEVSEPSQQLVILELAVLVRVQLGEDRLQLSGLLFRGHIHDHHGHRRLLQLLGRIELGHVSERLLHDGRVDLGRLRVLEPGVIQCFGGVNSLRIVLCEHFLDQDLGHRADLRPDSIVEV